MSGGSKYGLASVSPDKPTYPSGQRGVYGSASLNRSDRFRESMENRILSSRPTMPRSGSAYSPAEVASFLHNLPLDAKVMASRQKLPRQVEVTRILTASLGVSQDSAHSGSSTTRVQPEGIKEVKGALYETRSRASEQAKICTEMISIFDKGFPSLWSRKRSRSDVKPSDRSNISLAVDRFVSGGPAGKLSTQSNGASSGFAHEHQKLEEQCKIAVPSKHMDIRGGALGRPPAAVDREKEAFGLASGQFQSAEKDQALPIAIDGWEKSKMRKKRSGIKSDVSMNGIPIRSPDGDRESKRDTQQRLGIEARSRLSDVHGYRSGPSNGAFGVGKLDVTSQQTTGLGMRSTHRSDLDNGSIVNDRRDRLVGVAKEKINLKAVNKLNIRETNSASSPASTPKINASARGTRSSSGKIPKPLPNVHRAIGPDDWETPQNMNNGNAGTSNRKSTQSTRSSSPPVTQWGEQRPQKISRVARQTNFLPHLSGHDDALATENTSDVSGNESGPRHSSGNIVQQQARPKAEQLSSVTLSGSEESGSAEIRSKDKGKKATEIDEKSIQNYQKINTSGSSRKNKMCDEDFGSTVRRPGRGGRSSAAGRSSVSRALDKLDNTIKEKQLRSASHGSNRIVSKVGRPPNRKLSDRKAYTHPRHTMNSGVQDFLGESHDVQEELLAAANAAADPGLACSSPFWKQMEPLFSIGDFLVHHAIALGLHTSTSKGKVRTFPLRVPIVSSISRTLVSNPLPPTTGVAYRDNCSTIPNRFELIVCNGDRGIAREAKQSEYLSDHSILTRPDDSVNPLCQRLISALVSEEDVEEFRYTGDDDTSFGWDAELKAIPLNQRSRGNFRGIGKPVTNGYRIPASGRYRNGRVHDEVDFPAIQSSGIISSFWDASLDGLQADQELMPNTHCSENQYNQMALDERLLLELQSIGFYPDAVPDLAQREDAEINENARRAAEELNQLVTKKNHLLCNVEKSAAEARELREREIARRAYDKLVGLVYNKYMACFGPNASFGKGVSGKFAKQAALASVRRTLEQCQKFEDYGESCFSEPVFQDLFRSRSSNLKVSECVDMIIEGESANLYSNTGSRSTEVGVSGTHHIPPLIPQSGQNMDTHDMYHTDGFQSVNRLSDETTEKEDSGLTKIKKRKLLLDEVVGGTGTSLRAHSGIGSSLGTKGKRSERDRDAKRHNRETLPRTGPAKIGRPALGTVKGERKSKSKPKQKTTQLSASVNGLLGKDTKAVSISASRYFVNATNIDAKKDDDLSLVEPDESEALDLSHLPLPGIDDDLDGQGQDFDSIFKNIDDDALQDIDFMGLEIPMDDLSDLKMMV